MAGWWPAKAVWQTALAVALLVAGGFGGRYLARPRSETPEIAQLQSQVENLRQTVALSMLQDPSSSSRIRGVSYGSQVERPDRQIEQAWRNGLAFPTSSGRWWMLCRCRIRPWWRSP
jgi:hypothetical protein